MQCKNNKIKASQKIIQQIKIIIIKVIEQKSQTLLIVSSSKYVKQSNNISKNTMSNTQLQYQFEVKQIVWAKVPSQPWWPATVIARINQIGHSLSQKNDNIYKVQFFYDNTSQAPFACSCSLQSQQLLDFQSGFAELMFQQQHQTSLVLKNSIQLARATFLKNKLLCCQSENQHQCYSETQPVHADSFEQSKFQLKSVIENCRKNQIIQLNEIQIGSNNAFTNYQFQNIDQSNVIDLINSKNFKQLKNSKGYTNRKNAIALQLKFKQLLLSKYNLSQIPSTHETHKLIQNKGSIINVKKTGIKRQKLKNKSNIVVKSAKKLYCILKKQLNYTSIEAKNIITKSYQNLNQHFCSQNILNLPSNPKNNKIISLFYKNFLRDIYKKNSDSTNNIIGTKLIHSNEFVFDTYGNNLSNQSLSGRAGFKSLVLFNGQ